MAKNHLTKEQRQELGRRTQEKLRARIAEGSLPVDYYRQLGRRGFKVAMVKLGPQRMAELLGAYYGRPVDAAALKRNLEREREHAATRRAYPLEGRTCARCGALATERDHQDGWEAGHAPGTIAFLCHRCHVAVEIGRIKAS